MLLSPEPRRGEWAWNKKNKKLREKLKHDRFKKNTILEGAEYFRRHFKDKNDGTFGTPLDAILKSKEE